MKVEDVIMARVLSAPERVKKKSAKMSHNEPPEILSGKYSTVWKNCSPLLYFIVYCKLTSDLNSLQILNY